VRVGRTVVQRPMGISDIATTVRCLPLSDGGLVDAVNRAFPEDEV
jgi:hypothetical protein